MQHAMPSPHADVTQLLGRSVRLFPADGTPQGLIVAEITNWLAAPRARLINC